MQQWLAVVILTPHFEADPHAEIHVTKQTCLGLAVYNRNYWAKMITVLAGMFPSVFKQLGNHAFNLLMTDFLTDLPPQTYQFRLIGEQFPGWASKKSLDSQLLQLIIKDWESYRNL